jgi:hypothetical protein
MELVETPVFTRQVTEQLEDEDYRVAPAIAAYTPGGWCNYPEIRRAAQVTLALARARQTRWSSSYLLLESPAEPALPAVSVSEECSK